MLVDAVEAVGEPVAEERSLRLDVADHAHGGAVEREWDAVVDVQEAFAGGPRGAAGDSDPGRRPSHGDALFDRRRKELFDEFATFASSFECPLTLPVEGDCDSEVGGQGSRRRRRSAAGAGRYGHIAP